MYSAVFFVLICFLQASQSHHLEQTHTFQFMNFAQKGLWIPQKASVQKLIRMVKTLTFCLASSEINGVL